MEIGTLEKERRLRDSWRVTLRRRKKRPIAVCEKLAWTTGFAGFSARRVSIASPPMLLMVTVKGFGELCLLGLENKEKKKEEQGPLGPPLLK